MERPGEHREQGLNPAGTSIAVRPADEPVVGWRYWQLSPDRLVAPEGAVLRSVSHRRFGWPAGQPLRATCTSGGHRAPAERCNFGIYAAVDLDTLRARGMCLSPAPLVLGQVALWGRVASDEEGHRGEYAYPRSMLLVDETVPDGARSSLWEGLAWYGVPVGATSLDEALDEVSAMVLAHQILSLATGHHPRPV